MDPKVLVDPVDLDPLRVKRKTLEAVLLQCQRALELINATSNSTSNSSASADVNDDDCDGDVEATASADPDADEVFPFLVLGFRLRWNFYFSFLPI